MMKLSWLLCLSLLGGFAYAEAPQASDWLKVEVIVFQQQHMNDALQAETWPAVSLTAKSNWIQLVPQAEADMDDSSLVLPYRLLPNSEWTLAKSDKRLQDSDDYTVLLHEAWLQPVDAKAPVHITGGQFYPDQSMWQIDGSIRITKQRYYAVAANLALSLPYNTLPSTETAVDQNGLARFSLHQTQRMRAHAIHYLDNPLFGMLVVVDKVKS
ncbi:MAG: hypothetical protein DHS20C10_14310 [marine bacterium B5-7]|nr:MAG: hypothetical protein DHS20C10_14310 [marine bacterium B5-7]